MRLAPFYRGFSRNGSDENSMSVIESMGARKISQQVLHAWNHDWLQDRWRYNTKPGMIPDTVPNPNSRTVEYAESLVPLGNRWFTVVLQKDKASWNTKRLTLGHWTRYNMKVVLDFLNCTSTSPPPIVCFWFKCWLANSTRLYGSRSSQNLVPSTTSNQQHSADCKMV